MGRDSLNCGEPDNEGSHRMGHHSGWSEASSAGMGSGGEHASSSSSSGGQARHMEAGFGIGRRFDTHDSLRTAGTDADHSSFASSPVANGRGRQSNFDDELEPDTQADAHFSFKDAAAGEMADAEESSGKHPSATQEKSWLRKAKEVLLTKLDSIADSLDEVFVPPKPGEEPTSNCDLPMNGSDAKSSSAAGATDSSLSKQKRTISSRSGVGHSAKGRPRGMANGRPGGKLARVDEEPSKGGSPERAAHGKQREADLFRKWAKEEMKRKGRGKSQDGKVTERQDSDDETEEELYIRLMQMKGKGKGKGGEGYNPEEEEELYWRLMQMKGKGKSKDGDRYNPEEEEELYRRLMQMKGKGKGKGERYSPEEEEAVYRRLMQLKGKAKGDAKGGIADDWYDSEEEDEELFMQFMQFLEMKGKGKGKAGGKALSMEEEEELFMQFMQLKGKGKGKLGGSGKRGGKGYSPQEEAELYRQAVMMKGKGKGKWKGDSEEDSDDDTREPHWRRLELKGKATGKGTSKDGEDLPWDEKPVPGGYSALDENDPETQWRNMQLQLQAKGKAMRKGKGAHGDNAAYNQSSAAAARKGRGDPRLSQYYEWEQQQQYEPYGPKPQSIIYPGSEMQPWEEETLRLLDREGMPVYAYIGKEWQARRTVFSQDKRHLYVVEGTFGAPLADMDTAACFALIDLRQIARRTQPGTHIVSLQFEEGNIMLRFSYREYLEALIASIVQDRRVPVIEARD
eukprot:gnl/TRDRNA2_/TRDRNA2_130554_c0_seq1.p1 gnl/TRDRNA2_/TRDRNA2_130554_c0~~gnl/TRDRNA2_/TRDRNA2_130554_c0_seq1.p1  ORF type:complete len:738 (-),score=160.38 gnl/TRDRNA2_/TRDRNA2_130554_c0_seq1:202-2415(-)